MAIEIKVPTVGESISEVIIGEWLKPVGSQVALDEILVSLETDKVNVEVPAPAAGVISKVLKANGETARVGEVIGYIEGAATADKSAKAAPATAPAATAAPAAAPAATAAPATAPAAPAEPPAATAKTAEPRVMPAAARVLGQAGVAAASATGTGPGGRVMKEDAIRTLSQGQKIPLVYTTAPVPGSPEARQAEQIALAAAKPVQAPAPALEVAETPPTTKPPEATEVPAPVAVSAAETAGARREELVPMSPLRKRVAQRLVEAQHTAAILTTFNECDMSAVMELRKRHQDDFLAKHGVKLGFMSFFIKACVDALKAWPSVNAQIRGTDIAYQHFYDIGVAVGGGKGLVVPVVRNADQLGFAEIEKKLTDLGTRAKAGTLKLEELQGGTFSISNGGVYGSMLSTPILNPPQSGILGMHNIISRPIGVDGQVVLRPMMYLALSYDHRLVDGREAVSFLIHVKKCIEAPERLLLGL